jgi:hypothetical protein
VKRAISNAGRKEEVGLIDMERPLSNLRIQPEEPGGVDEHRARSSDEGEVLRVLARICATAGTVPDPSPLEIR